MNKVLKVFDFLLVAALFTPSAYAGPLPFTDLSFDELEKIISEDRKKANPSIKSVETLLEKLPPSYLASHTLAKSSNSTQHGDPLNPRAIVFGKSAKMILAFDGGGAQGTNDIEIIHWDEKSKKFEFRQLKFSSENGAQFSQPNPAACQSCHVTGPQGMTPLWDPYDVWPDFYGMKDDNIHDELKEFKAYRSHAATHGRYKYLQDASRHTYFPYYNEQSPTKLINYKDPKGRRLVNQPNTRLSEKLVALAAMQTNAHVQKNQLADLYPLFIALDSNPRCIGDFYEKIRKSLGSYLPPRKVKPGQYDAKLQDIDVVAVQTFLKKIVFLEMQKAKLPLPSEIELNASSVPELMLRMFDVPKNYLRRTPIEEYSFASEDPNQSTGGVGYKRGRQFESGFATFTDTMKHLWIEEKYVKAPWFKSAGEALYGDIVSTFDQTYADLKGSGIDYPYYKLDCASENAGTLGMVAQIQEEALSRIAKTAKEAGSKQLKYSLTALSQRLSIENADSAARQHGN